ncbi:MAG: hypothetical protein ACR2PL_21850 [Dehalococcoidia bacterium]
MRIRNTGRGIAIRARLAGLLIAILLAGAFVPRASGAAGCAPLVLNAGASVNGYLTDQYVWYDSACKQRSAALVRTDPKGGHAKQFTYQLPNGATRTVNEGPDAGGFGYIVSHLKDANIAGQHGEDDSPLGSNQNAGYRTVFAGTNHAIHEFTVNYPRWGIDPVTGVQTKYNVPVTVQWLFATGRDNPLWTVTYDLSQAPANAVDADTRAPYGDMNFDGAPTGSYGDEIGGVAWGESDQFRSTSAPLTLDSSWDWSHPNTLAPYNAIWTQNVDAEMGIAGTQVSSKEDAGGYEGGVGRGLTSANAAQCPYDGVPHVMPCLFAWPYQSVNYAFYDGNGNLQPNQTTGDKRLAWGADWGYLGQQTVTTINGNTVHGWPKVSYSTSIVLGPHSTNPTQAAAQQAAVVDATTLTASVGTVVTQGPAGVNRADTMAYSPAGYNPIYGTWEANAANNQATLTFAVGAGAMLSNPVIVLHGYTGNAVPASVTLNGATLQNNVDFFASSRAETQDLWLTLNKNLSGAQTLALGNNSMPTPTPTPTFHSCGGISLYAYLFCFNPFLLPVVHGSLTTTKVKLTVHAGAQPVRTARVSYRYDPQRLQLTCGESLASCDTAQPGRITVQLTASAPLSGSVDLASLQVLRLPDTSTLARGQVASAAESTDSLTPVDAMVTDSNNVTTTANADGAEVVTVVTGDVNGDGQVTAVDALCVLRNVTALAATDTCPLIPLTVPSPGDVNNDNAVNAVDALCILRSVAGLQGTQACSTIPIPAAGGAARPARR